MAKKTHAQIWSHLKSIMKDHWHACRHEDLLSVGIPDISFGLDGIQGWIEMKSLSSWPIRNNRKIPDLTIHQVRWLEARGRTGGSCWILLSVETDYILIPWTQGDQLRIEGLPKKDRIDWPMWSGRLDRITFTKTLIKRNEK
jgi:hypothetical protein